MRHACGSAGLQHRQQRVQLLSAMRSSISCICVWHEASTNERACRAVGGQYCQHTCSSWHGSVMGHCKGCHCYAYSFAPLKHMVDFARAQRTPVCVAPAPVHPGATDEWPHGLLCEVHMLGRRCRMHWCSVTPGIRHRNASGVMQRPQQRNRLLKLVVEPSRWEPQAESQEVQQPPAHSGHCIKVRRDSWPIVRQQVRRRPLVRTLHGALQCMNRASAAQPPPVNRDRLARHAQLLQSDST